MRQKVGVVGLGYIGLPLLVILADVGYKVVGMDADEEKVNSLQQTLTADIYEPGLNELLKHHKNEIEFTASCEHLMEQCFAIIITIGTPFKDKDILDINNINHLVTALGKHLEREHLIILRSTVYPGLTKQVALELEKTSGLKAGSDFYIAFSPERTVEGLALHELISLPKIVGGINSKSTEQAASVLKRLGGKVIKVSSPEVAEMCKLADNAYRAVNIAFANEIGNICEKSSIDAHEVIAAVNDAYQRNHIFQPGLGAEGPCLSKDPQILKYYADREGVDTKLINASIAINSEATLRIANITSHYLRTQMIQKPKISLVGLAFKGFPTTDDTRNSPSTKIYYALQQDFDTAEFQFYDPLVKSFMSKPVSPSLSECIQGSNVTMFLTNHPLLMNIDVNDILAKSGRPLLIIDCWHNITNLDQIKDSDIQIFRIGDRML